MKNKQTKIICTIADNRCEPEFIKSLIDQGMNVARLNTAHISPPDADRIIANIRSVSDHVGILIDTKGPEVRTCNIEKEIELEINDIVHITTYPIQKNGFQVNYTEFVSEVPVGNYILIDDGELQLLVTEKTETALICIATNKGVIKNRKSINVPQTKLDLPSLTEKDAEFIDWATQADVEFIAHSFVRNRDDVMAIQSILDMRKSSIKIIAKIENHEGVTNLESILDVAYGVMIARGDLGIEIPAEEVPLIQKQMIKTCIRRVKPVITATQMLHSMITNPRPTRAEVSDVANAICDGTDAIMLSGETAYGEYPVEAVQTMANIANNIETKRETTNTITQLQQSTTFLARNELAKAAVSISAALPTTAIITSTKSGDTARVCASFRGKTPIFALSENIRTVRELSLSYGIHAEQIPVPHTTDELVTICLNKLLEKEFIQPQDLIVLIGGGHLHSAHTNFLQVDTPALLLKENK